MPKLNKFSLYLAKADVKTFEEILTDNARYLIKRELAKTYRSSYLALGAVLYTFPGQLAPPRWVTLLKGSFPIGDNLFAQTPSALLIFKADDHIFAVSFSYA